MYLSILQAFILSFMTKIILCNENPVIGVLTQDTSWTKYQLFLPLNSSYIAASYVKSIESSGGRVVPVFTNRTPEYYE